MPSGHQGRSTWLNQLYDLDKKGYVYYIYINLQKIQAIYKSTKKCNYIFGSDYQKICLFFGYNAIEQLTTLTDETTKL